MSEGAGFVELLQDHNLVHLDASVLALHAAGVPRTLPLTRSLFRAMEAGEVAAQTSALSLYQLLVESYRRGEESTAARIEQLIGSIPGLRVIPLDGRIARQAAQVRAQIGGRVERRRFRRARTSFWRSGLRCAGSPGWPSNPSMRCNQQKREARPAPPDGRATRSNPVVERAEQEPGRNLGFVVGRLRRETTSEGCDAPHRLLADGWKQECRAFSTGRQNRLLGIAEIRESTFASCRVRVLAENSLDHQLIQDHAWDRCICVVETSGHHRTR